VGRVTAIAWPEHANLAAALAEAADHATAFPGIGALPGDRPIRLVLAPDRARFDSITSFRLPAWSEGAALPEVGVVVLLVRRDPARLRAALRHELAHLALRWRVGRPQPLWLEEGYAALAAGEWDRLAALRLNWQLARGRRMALDEVSRALRGGAGDAGAAYGLATTAVLLLERWGGERGLAPFLDALARSGGVDDALRATYFLTEGDFEVRWQRDVSRRYGWLAGAAAATFAWAVLAVAVAGLALWRRRRDRRRRAALDAVPWGGPEPPPDAPNA
jgi:hypothetical protein